MKRSIRTSDSCARNCIADNKCSMVAQDNAPHDVWASNLDAEFANMRKAAKTASYVVACIEFPGLCMTPLGTFFSQEHFTYQQLLVNVNGLKPIQFGFTFVYESAAPGEPQLLTFQYNLHFDLDEDMFTDDAIRAYEQAGMDFKRHNTDGIKLLDFGEHFTTSGLIASKLKWASFYSAFDFGYLTRSLCGGALPPDIRAFYRMFRRYFPDAVDIKYMMRDPTLVHLGLRPNMSLQEVADTLNINRWGPKHVAGSDSWLAARVYMHLKNEIPNWQEISNKISGLIEGLGGEPILPQGAIIQTIFSTKSTTQSNNNEHQSHRYRPFSAVSNT